MGQNLVVRYQGPKWRKGLLKSDEKDLYGEMEMIYISILSEAKEKTLRSSKLFALHIWKNTERH